jgi:hypothetical protein
MRFQFKIPHFFNFRLILGNDFRSRGHEAFDKIWKNKHMSRNKAYKWLAEQMNIPREACHFSLFNEKECEKAIKICNKYIEENKKEKKNG